MSSAPTLNLLNVATGMTNAIIEEKRHERGVKAGVEACLRILGWRFDSMKKVYIDQSDSP